MAAGAGKDHLSLEIRETGLSMGRLAERLQRAGSRGGLKRELDLALRQAGRPLRQAAQRGARETLPKHGGLATLVAGSRFATSGGVRGTTVVLNFTATNGHHDLAAMNRGRLRHPVYGNRRVWVIQRITPRWFTRYESVGEAAARTLLEGALQRIAKSIAK